MFKVYVLTNQSGTRYVGQTKDIDKRIVAHNTNMSRYTKNKGPWKLVYSEDFETRSEAMKREKYFKTGKGRELLDNLPK
ncbi:GIY-YIG nuclease family protein [Candidatus Saccharibacteria bacterium]|nr:GIY-YIG nuclease family protein [Candidatus Saccharibacteria bacterium]